jgi:uncharacterized Zn finger protein (UPF0148 family)
LLVCPHCNHKFVHSKIDEKAVQEAYRDSYGIVAKPNLAVQKLTCPYCELASSYQRFQLMYSEDDSDPAAKGHSA